MRSNATQGVFGYMALYGDFGEHEHIFSPVSISDCVCRIVLTELLRVGVAEEVGGEEQGRILAAFTGGKKASSKRGARRGYE